MDDAALRELIDQMAAGEVDADEVVRRLRRLPFAELGYAMVDHHRELRQGLPEAVYGPGKRADQCVGIVGELLSGEEPGGGPVVLSRADDEQIAAVIDAFPAGVVTGSTVVWRPAALREEAVLVVTAGTADLQVADECQATLRAFGFGAALVADVGVAGLHRLLAHVDLVQAADAVVVVAGMEGALASVVGGLTAAPVVAVPTSVGYGASLEGVTALLSMMASCASGITVVGIDNGFGAAHAVARMLGPAPAPATPPPGGCLLETAAGNRTDPARTRGDLTP
ncbi:MAG TPA: nickel pincer cofactor biosynthesis protein LarB [Acidimicrobiales bacterium]|nr:nickel pincer cofactor biosynthesis protein LarB [Acidimicrobiales bacterium]